MPRRFPWLLLLAVCCSAPALADRREFYVEAAAGPALTQLRQLGAPGFAAPRTGPSATLSTYYGLTNALHVGGGLYFATARDFHVAGAQLSPNDFTGDLWTAWLGAGASVFAVYRLDTGYPLAPFFRLELSVGANRFSHLALVPDGRNYYEPHPDRWELSLGGRAAFGVEFRLADSWIITVAAAGRAAPVGHSGVAFEVPVAVAYVW